MPFGSADRLLISLDDALPNRQQALVAGKFSPLLFSPLTCLTMSFDNGVGHRLRRARPGGAEEGARSAAAEAHRQQQRQRQQ